MKISVPSWVIPGSYAENLRFLADKSTVSNVELLFFIYNEETQKLLLKELDEISCFSSRFSFTAHLPAPFLAGHLPLIEQLFPLVTHFIAHPAAGDDGRLLAAFLGTLQQRFGQNHFVIENVKLPEFESFIQQLDEKTPLCMDTGHLQLEGASVLGFYQKYAARIQEIHLHQAAAAPGSQKPADHRALTTDAPWLMEVLPELRVFNGIINIEVFSWEDIVKSLEVLDEYQCFC